MLRSMLRVWCAPGVLALISAAGLLSGLLADGVGDVVSWLALAAPIVVVLYRVARPT